MEKNVGGTERIVRLVGGFVLVLVGVGIDIYIDTGVPPPAVGASVRIGIGIVIVAVLAGAPLALDRTDTGVSSQSTTRSDHLPSVIPEEEDRDRVHRPRAREIQYEASKGVRRCP